MQGQPDTTQLLRLTVNGQQMEVNATSLAGLLRHLEIDDSAVVAEVNGAITAREFFSHTLLQNGDQIELVRFVGGG